MTDTDDTPTDDTAPDRQTWTYKGRRWHGGQRKLFYAWVGPDGDDRWYAKLKGAIVGGAYLVALEGDSVYLNPEYVGLGEADEAIRLKWAAETRAAVAASEAAATERRLTRDGDDLLAALDPVREMYRRTVGAGRRAALLAAVIQAVTG